MAFGSGSTNWHIAGHQALMVCTARVEGDGNGSESLLTKDMYRMPVAPVLHFSKCISSYLESLFVQKHSISQACRAVSS